MKKLLLLLVTISLTFVTTVHAQNEDFYNQNTYQTVLDSGVYKIGSNLDAGTYRIISNSEYGMYVVSSDANQEDIIDVSPVSTHSYVEVSDNQYLKLDGVFAVQVDDVEPIPIGDNTITAGTYAVGFDIPAGEYQVIQDEEYAMYVVYGSLDKSDIVTVSPITNNAFVEVTDGQYLQIDGASITDDKLVSTTKKTKVTVDSSSIELNPDSYESTVLYIQDKLDAVEGYEMNTKLNDGTIIAQTTFPIGNIVTSTPDGKVRFIRLNLDNYLDAENILNDLDYPITNSFSWVFDIEKNDLRHRGVADFSKHENKAVLAKRYNKNELEFSLTISFDEELSEELNQEYKNIPQK